MTKKRVNRRNGTLYVQSSQFNHYIIKEGESIENTVCEGNHLSMVFVDDQGNSTRPFTLDSVPLWMLKLYQKCTQKIVS